MRINLRDRRPADLGRCVDALRAVHDADGYPLNWPDDPRGWLCPDGLLAAWVAETTGGTVAGHLALTRVTPAAAPEQPAGPAALAASVSRLFVVPAFRRRSVGRRLLAVAQEWATGRALDLILDVVDDGRSAAVALYEDTGWRLSHRSRADWTGPGGKPVHLLHYRYPGQGAGDGR